MKLNYLLLLVCIVKIFGGINASCVYNGLDYTPLSFASFNYNTGHYKYYYAVCNSALGCPSGSAGCQIDENFSNFENSLGSVGSGNFSTKNGKTVLSYQDSAATCGSPLKKRILNIELVPSSVRLPNGFIESEVTETSSCVYGVTVTYDPSMVKTAC
ncbi:hypothetical protein DICPUDRAFT_76572 [Dictyostelium purpureum]|uniref:MRH domain-containing protein n=1 Tax=Dictyostelium purpureum TaxID=5786 RepID=F0ZE06_DICPU|nr:uncharacterized protein DICPUDRAFT_76572 [Dictyostelium purpureum]EGC37797.1 hypothetical protein DICPUDRAFT_76572 [Dictyostelium purpureum]|eukprot:XP_003285642.1 hypothetical protein DICPUDRAFT_76572 [Dictyostelium purpureum]